MAHAATETRNVSLAVIRHRCSGRGQEGDRSPGLVERATTARSISNIQ